MRGQTSWDLCIYRLLAQLRAFARMSHRPFTFGPKKRRTERSAAYARPAPKRREAQRLPTPTDRLPRRYGLPVYLGCLLYLSTDSGQNSHPQSLDAVDATSHNTGQRQPRPTLDAVDATMIDFDIYEDSDANKPRRRRRAATSTKLEKTRCWLGGSSRPGAQEIKRGRLAATRASSENRLSRQPRRQRRVAN